MCGVNSVDLHKKAKSYKKILETYDIYPYSYRDEKDTDYFYVSYKRFNKVNGAVILTNDNSQKKHEIIEAFKMIYNFNRTMAEALDQMIPDIKKPVSVLQEIKILLSEAESEFLSVFDNDMESVINDFYKLLDHVIRFPEELVIILKEMQAIEKDVLNRKYLLKENVNRMMELNAKHYQIMYDQGRSQLKAIEKARILLEEIKLLDMSEKINNKQLIVHLNIFSADRAIKDVKKSQATFEIDEYGNKVTFSSGKVGLEEYKEIFYRRVDYIFEKNIKKKLRNFQ
jgi:hypothetical protein